MARLSSIVYPLIFDMIDPQRILIIKPSAIGDVVHALPVLKKLRDRFPRSHIAWLVTPACAGLLDGHPLLDEVVRFERRRFGKGWRDPAAAAGLLSFTRALRRKKFDLVVDLQGLFRSGWLAWQTRAPMRIGLSSAREFAWMFYTHRVSVGRHNQHAVNRYLKVCELLDCESANPEFIFNTDEKTRDEVREMLRSHEREFVGADGSAVRDTHGLASVATTSIQPYAVLMPGSVWETKRWPAHRFAQLIPKLNGMKTVLAGGPDDVGLAEEIPADINLAGKTSLKQLVALLERASVVIANDSGPMHIAAALGVPLVTPFGPTNPVRTGPFGRMDSVVRLGVECSPCYSRTCWHQSCMRKIDADLVMQKVELQMNGRIVR